MTTTKNRETTRKGRGSRKVSEKVTANELQTVVNSVPVSVPVGSGLSDGVTAVSSGSVSVGSSSASSRRAARLDMRAKLENSLRFEGFKLSVGVRDFSQKLGGFFAAKEWTGTAAETVRASLDGMFTSGIINEEQKEMMWRAAAKNAGIDLSAPNCSAGRMLAVVRREGLIPEFVSLVGMSFADVVAHIKENGLCSYSWRLSVSVVRSNSALSDFVDCSPVAPGASASAIVAALLSLREVTEFNRRLSAARSSDRSDYKTYIALAVRLAKRLNYDLDRVLLGVKNDYEFCETSDAKERKQLRKNLASAIETINAKNDLILSLGGVTVLDSDTCTAKTARTIKGALKERARAYSVASTIDKLLQM